MTKRVVGTTVSGAAEIDALPVGAALISAGRVSGQVYIQHSPGRWRNGVSGSERWAQALTGIAPLVVVYMPSNGAVGADIPFSEEHAVNAVIDRLVREFPDSQQVVFYGDQIQRVLENTRDSLIREGLL